MKPQWYNNWKIELLITDLNDIPEGFEKGRLKKNLIRLLSQITKEELFNYYMIDNHPFEETFLHFNLTRGELRQLLKYYNIHKDQKQAAKNNNYKRSKEQVKEVAKKSSLTQKQTWKNKSEEEKEQWRQQQIQSHSTYKYRSNQSSIVKEAQKNMSVEYKEELNHSRSETLKKLWEKDKEELLKQRSDTAKLNRKKESRLCRTKLEQKVYDVLSLIYPDIQYDVKVDNRYPYFVDFYIPSLDVFIELQGHPSHGKVPYEQENEQSLQEAYKLYGDWLRIYTQVDVEKYNTAKSNKINIVRVYPFTSIEENYKINKNIDSNLIDLIFSSL